MVDVNQERVRSNLRSSMSDWFRLCFNNTSSCLFISMLSVTKFVSTDVYMWSFEAAAIACNRNNQRQDVRVISILVKWLPVPAFFTNMYIQHPLSVLYHCLSLEIVRTQNCRKSLHACAEPYNAIPCSLVGKHMVSEENEQNPFLKSHDVLHMSHGHVQNEFVRLIFMFVYFLWFLSLFSFSPVHRCNNTKSKQWECIPL